jgi:hypothetical protein
VSDVVSTFRKENRVWVFKNRMFGRLFGALREEVEGVWRKLYNDKLIILSL